MERIRRNHNFLFSSFFGHLLQVAARKLAVAEKKKKKTSQVLQPGQTHSKYAKLTKYKM
jgi:hypothetical protein